MNTATAGARNGTATIAFVSDANNVGGCGANCQLSLPSQNVTVTGNVYQIANGAATPASVTLANQRVGGATSQALTVTNNAAGPTGFVEDLRASFGANTGAATNNSGTINALVAGGNNNAAMSVGVDTATAGNKTGSVSLAYQTTGTVNGSSNGLGVAAANGPQVISVSGNVYQVAQGQLITAPLNFGTVQVGQTGVFQDLTIRNTATGAAGFVEDLKANFGATSGTGAGLISGAGQLVGIEGGQTSNAGNGLMRVSVNTAAAGTVNGAIAVNFITMGTVVGNSNGLGELGVGQASYGVSGTIQATGNVINQASPLINNSTINLGSVRVGATSPTANVSVTNVATVAPQAALNASISGNAPITASGGFNLLAPGATNNSALQVGMNTATAGAISGTATVAFVSDASNVGNCAPNCQLTLGSQNVTVTGRVYTAAAAAVSNVISFGTVHVGDVIAPRGVTVQNSASATALNDTLFAQIGAATGPFTSNSGSVAGLLAGGAANNSALAVGLDTTNAGVFNGSASIALASQNPDMADLALLSQNVILSGTVNNYANAVFDIASGAGSLTRSGNQFTLNFGNVLQGAGALSALVDVDNFVSGPADFLNGSLSVLDGNDFGTSLLASNFANIAAGGSSGNLLSFLFNTSTLGTFDDLINLTWFGTNNSGFVGTNTQYTLRVTGTVFEQNGNVPIPGSLLLIVIGLAGMGFSRLRKAA